MNEDAMTRPRPSATTAPSPAKSRRRFIARTGQASLLVLAWPGLAAAEPRSAGRLPAVPYYSSRSDLDCTLAAARMILGALEPDQHFPLEDVKDMVFNRPGRWVFEAQLIPILEQEGYRVRLYATTAYPELAAGKGFSRYGPEAGERIDREALAWAAARLTPKNFTPGEPELRAAIAWLEQGDLIMISAQRAALRNNPALPYCRYNLALIGSEQTKVFYHDPGAGPGRSGSLKFMDRVFTENAPDRAVLRVGRTMK